MKNSKQLKKTIQKLVKISFQNGRLLESQIMKAIKLLRSLPSYEAIPAMSEYLKLLRSEERKHTLFIETTIPLSSAQIQKAKKIVEKKVKITKVLTKINPEILGGFKLKIGDEVWDESVRGKIQQIKEAIIS